MIFPCLITTQHFLKKSKLSFIHVPSFCFLTPHQSLLSHHTRTADVASLYSDYSWSIPKPVIFKLVKTSTSVSLSGLPRWLSGKESACQCRRHRLDIWVRKVLWRRKWQPTPVFLPGEFYGQRSMAEYSPWHVKSQTWLSNWACTHECVFILKNIRII